MSTAAWDFIVSKGDLRQTRVDVAPPADLAEGDIRLSVDSFALTANNITYAVYGERMGYWKFYPAPEGWGRVPVWGYATVEASRHPEIAVGQRFFGYVPMSSHMTATPRKTGGGFFETAPWRAELAAPYNQYRVVDASETHEDQQSLLYPLFMTSFLIDDMLTDNDLYGAASVVLSSASSKTAIGLAHLLHRAGKVKVVGLTSPGNVAFVESLGCYDQVVPYAGLGGAAIAGPVVYVDFAGDAAVRAAVHHRFAEALVHDCVVGGTHWEAAPERPTDLPGAPPTFFFAPDRITKRRADWGPGGLEAKFGEAWPVFIDDATRWMTVRHLKGPEATAAAFKEVLDGRTPPSDGIIVRP
ncbi:MAG: DUF2855 family protein [Caulobacter sp.]|nr:DUF2855 family protein [Caulobacter sp.]